MAKAPRATKTTAKKPATPKPTKENILAALREALAAISASLAEGDVTRLRAFADSATHAFAAAVTGSTATEADPGPAQLVADGPVQTVVDEPPKTYRIYTDGSCLGNGSRDAKGGWAYAIVADGKVAHQASGGSRGATTTNNSMELTAIEMALAHTEPGSKVVIATDSQLAIGWIFKNWQCGVPHNKVILARIGQLMRKRHVGHEKVKGHSGEEFNDVVDGLAAAAAMRQ